MKRTILVAGALDEELAVRVHARRAGLVLRAQRVLGDVEAAIDAAGDRLVDGGVEEAGALLEDSVGQLDIRPTEKDVAAAGPP